MTKPTEAQIAKADQAFWENIGKPHDWVLFGWSYRETASFNTGTPATIHLDRQLTEALLRERAAPAKAIPPHLRYKPPGTL